MVSLNSTSTLRTMSDESLDLFEQEFWSEVEEFAKEMNLPLSYVEEEFIVDGELIKQAKDLPKYISDDEFGM